MKRIEIEYWPLSRLVPYARIRARTIAVERMVAFLREFDSKIPMLVRSTGEVIAGRNQSSDAT